MAAGNTSTPEETPSNKSFWGTKSDSAAMFQMITGFRISQLVRSAAMLNLAEHLADGLSTPAQIASVESLDPDATLRLMRACSAIGLLQYEGDLKFSATPLLNTLHKDSPGSLRFVAISQPGPGQWIPWSNLTEAVRTGEAQAKATLGCDIWEHFRRLPAEGLAFNETMTTVTTMVAQEALKWIDTTNVSLAVDIGGASGVLIHSLMQANPHLHGAVLDLPTIAPEAERAAAKLGLQDRFSAIAGDFFSQVPPADLYLLKWILHDWLDHECISILKNCRRSIRPGGRIVLIEMIVPELDCSNYTALVDLTMLTAIGGRERTLEEFQKLLSSAGFRFLRVTPTSTPLSIIEAEAE